MTEDVKHKLRIYTQLELTKELYTSFPVSVISLLAVVSFIIWQLYDSSNVKLLFWYLSLCVILILRCVLFLWYKLTKSQINLQKHHYYLFITGSSLTALFLGILGTLLMPDNLMQQAYILILMSGILAGAVQSLSASYFANLLYIYLALIPVLIWELVQIYEKKYIYIGIFISMSIFCLFTYKIARAVYSRLVKHIELEYKYKILSKKLSKSKKKYKRQAIHDFLTGLFNRQFLNEFLEIEVHKAQRDKSEFAIIMMDIDLFKKVNDTYGHDAGDEVLRTLAQFLQKSIRKSDIACRYGGEEFIIVLPENSLNNAILVAELLRKAVKNLSIQTKNGSISNISMSFGVSSFPYHGLTREKIVNAADKALYQAKQQGRDRVCIGPLIDNILSNAEYTEIMNLLESIKRPESSNPNNQNNRR